MISGVKFPTTAGAEDFHVIRFAEVLLIKAEAQARLNDLAGAVDTYNLIRERAELPPHSLGGDVSTQEEVLAAIDLERRLELAFEGDRWADLVRTGQAVARARHSGDPDPVSDSATGDGCRAGHYAESRILRRIMTLSRREFLRRGAAVGLAASTPLPGQLAAPWVRRSTAAEPVVISSMNGNWYKNGGSVGCVEKAFTQMTQGGDVLDALIAGVNITELDPEEDSVGYGGLPNADGVVQLDSCCMHGPRKRAGGVAGLEGVRTPSKVAQAVMDQTDHHLLVGAGAQQFARSLGFTIEPDLNTEHSRKAWLEWKRQIRPEALSRPPAPGRGGPADSRLAVRGRVSLVAGGARHDQLRRHQRQG